MRVLVQRVRSANVKIGGQEVAAIGKGALLLVGIGSGDTVADAEYLAGKSARLRIFDDDRGRMNLAIDRVAGRFLAVSQFTLYADCRKGNRPSYAAAAGTELGQELYECYVEELRSLGNDVATGEFGAEMLVGIENDGPVTLMLESAGR